MAARNVAALDTDGAALPATVQATAAQTRIAVTIRPWPVRLGARYFPFQGAISDGSNQP